MREWLDLRFRDNSEASLAWGVKPRYGNIRRARILIHSCSRNEQFVTAAAGVLRQNMSLMSVCILLFDSVVQVEHTGII